MLYIVIVQNIYREIDKQKVKDRYIYIYIYMYILKLNKVIINQNKLNI